MKRHIYDVYGKKGLDADWQVSCNVLLFMRWMSVMVAFQLKEKCNQMIV